MMFGTNETAPCGLASLIARPRGALGGLAMGWLCMGALVAAAVAVVDLLVVKILFNTYIYVNTVLTAPPKRC